MKLQGEYVFNGPREAVWELVRDPEVLASVLPGTQSMNKVSDTEYEGQMHVRIGPVGGVFSGRVLVSNEVPPESYTLSVEGRGAPGFGRGTGDVQLLDQGDGTTLMKYEGELQVGGKLAGVGQRMVETVSKSMTRQMLESLNKTLQARMSPQAEGVESEQVEYKPPSEAEFAKGVVKDMAADIAASLPSVADIFAPENQTTWIAVIAALIGVVVGFWLGKKASQP
ncbi:MAG: carbon monoxide dehydrogenase subunit G [Chloroflexi bacterium]|nr:carbon monoxide dehydrogenase subunit G [Chloroflexota bacterium]